ncbi:MAG: hypothetical protein NVS9B1_21300 [Candidatus Dormibacteraceae bacterium]
MPEPPAGRRERIPTRLGPAVRQLGPPVSNVPWSSQVVAQSLEILPVTVCDGSPVWLRPVHAPSLRVGISKAEEPAAVVLSVMAWYPLTARVVHSTSWRYEEGRIVLTYLAVVECPQRLPEGSLELVPIERADLARGESTAPPASITVAAVLEHAVRHLAWLNREDPAIAAELETWSAVLADYRPEPFRALG